MRSILCGVETEYGFAALPRPGVDKVVGDPLARLMRRAEQTLVHIRGLRAGLFLANGARFYVDCGRHPEFATPECDNPWDVVRYVKAGDHILDGLAAHVTSTTPTVAELLTFRGNVDLTGEGSTWGCHESYCHRIAPNALAPQIIPHLVSRVIYSGAGGFHPQSAGLEFSLSPRAAYIERTTSTQSTSGRGIYHTKNEPLGTGHHRLHVLCGESLCSDLGTWLKVGTTALIVAAVDAGCHTFASLALRDPVAALRTVAADPTCAARVDLVDGRRVTAREIQRAYLDAIETRLGWPSLPPWAAAVCAAWRDVLDRLTGAPTSVERTLDWAIKRRIYEGRVTDAGFAWDALAPGGAAAASTEARQLRGRLFEAETRYAQVGARGVFNSLDRAGVLEHRVHGVDGILRATLQPPTGTRAEARGNAIRRLAGNPRWRCDWTGIWDAEDESRLVDLSDPFTRSGQMPPSARGRAARGHASPAP